MKDANKILESISSQSCCQPSCSLWAYVEDLICQIRNGGYSWTLIIVLRYRDQCKWHCRHDRRATCSWMVDILETFPQCRPRCKLSRCVWRCLDMSRLWNKQIVIRNDRWYFNTIDCPPVRTIKNEILRTALCIRFTLSHCRITYFTIDSWLETGKFFNSFQFFPIFFNFPMNESSKIKHSNEMLQITPTPLCFRNLFDVNHFDLDIVLVQFWNLNS